MCEVRSYVYREVENKISWFNFSKEDTKIGQENSCFLTY